MELERDIRIVIVAHLNDEKCIEPTKIKTNEYKIRFNKELKNIPVLYSENEDKTSDYIDGFQMKCRFIKSNHISSFTKEKDRLIEITEPIQQKPHIIIHKHYPIGSFDLTMLAARLTHKSLSLNDWWRTFKILISTAHPDPNEKQIELLCAPAFNLPLPKQIARQAACLIKFYEMFKASLFTIYHQSSSSSSLLSSISHVLPAIQLSFRPTILHSFDERIRTHKRLKSLLSNNCVCLVAYGSKKTSFRYDFSLLEFHIINQFNTSEQQLNTLVKRFALKYLRCSLDNYFLRTSVLWICEIHDLENYHHIFEVWISFMRDVCRKRFLSHYFLDNVDIYEEHPNLEETIKTIDYQNIDSFIAKLNENLIFPYIYQYNDRMNILITFFESQPVLALKMKMVYNVMVKSQFLNADCSLNEMCSILCHLSFLEDDDRERVISFWDQQWKFLFLQFDRDDIVLKQPAMDARPDQLAQQMTASVFKLIQIDLNQMIGTVKSDSKENERIFVDEKEQTNETSECTDNITA